jgi:hypothetical protein
MQPVFLFSHRGSAKKSELIFQLIKMQKKPQRRETDLIGTPHKKGGGHNKWMVTEQKGESLPKLTCLNEKFN